MNKPDFVQHFLHSDFMDELISYRIKESIEMCQADIQRLGDLDKLEPYQEEDLKDFMDQIRYLTDTYRYYSGDICYAPEYYRDE